MQEGRIRLHAFLRSVQLHSTTAQPSVAVASASSMPARRSASPVLPAAVAGKGEQDRIAQETADRQAMLAAWKTLEVRIQEVTEQNRLQLAELSQIAIEMALLMAEKIVGQQLEAGAYAVEKIVAEAIGRMSDENRLSVSLHPEDLQLLRTVLGDEMPGSGEQQVVLRGDATLARGDCLVEAGEHGLLAGVKKQLADMRSSLLESLHAA